MERRIRLAAILAAIVALWGCGKENTETVTTSYVVSFLYSPAVEAQAKLSYDTKFKETLLFYEYDASGNQVAARNVASPKVGSDYTFTANEAATRLVIYYDVTGTTPDGKAMSMGIYFGGVHTLAKGSTYAYAIVSSSKTSEGNPISK